MDQKSLYELQTGAGKLIQDNFDAALIVRDRYVVKIISKYVGLQNRTLNLAELSIGEGRLTRALKQNFHEMNINCIDISLSRIMHVKALLEGIPDGDAGQVTFTECNFDTEFKLIESDEYDVVVALDIMEHVLDVFGFIENCNRVLVQNGLLIIRVPNIAYVKHRMRLLAGNLPVTASWFGPPECFDGWRDRHGWDGGHLHFFTIPMLVKLLSESGFSIEKCRDPGTKFSAIRGLWPNLLYSNPLIVARKER